jgi:hypothetical protein
MYRHIHVLLAYHLPLLIIDTYFFLLCDHVISYSIAYSSLLLLLSSLHYLVTDGVSVAVVIPEGKEKGGEGET